MHDKTGDVRINVTSRQIRVIILPWKAANITQSEINSRLHKTWLKSFEKLSERQFVKADLLRCLLTQAELTFMFCCETAVIHIELISLSKY